MKKRFMLYMGSELFGTYTDLSRLLIDFNRFKRNHPTYVKHIPSRVEIYDLVETISIEDIWRKIQ